MYSAMAPGVRRLKPKMSCGPHMWYAPDRQYRQVQQGTICSATTRSPTAVCQRPAAASSSCTTVPTNSWPGVTGVST